MERQRMYQEIKELIEQKREFKPYWFNDDCYLGLGEILTIDEMEKLKADPKRKFELLVFEKDGENVYPVNK